MGDERKRFENVLQIPHAEALFDQASQDIRELRHRDRLWHDLSHRGGGDLLELIEEQLCFGDAEEVDGALPQRRQDAADHELGDVIGVNVSRDRNERSRELLERKHDVTLGKGRRDANVGAGQGDSELTEQDLAAEFDSAFKATGQKRRAA